MSTPDLLPKSTAFFLKNPGKEDAGRGDHAPTWTKKSFLSRPHFGCGFRYFQSKMR
jgi:hypothetical protein